MFFQQVLYGDLGCASYVLGDASEAVVVDPRVDIDVYLEIAQEHGASITHVIDTHDHADHVSGRGRLAAVTGAQVHRPARPHDRRDGDLASGDELRLGSLLIRTIATPGHRPEHLGFAVSDLSRSPDPWMVLTGDSLLVGDLARPDLAVEADEGARDLHASLSALLSLGDHVEVWPGHTGGSLCGGAGLSGKTSSTIGFERIHNPLLRFDQDRFVAALIDGLPARPPNCQRIVEINRAASDVEPSPALRALGMRELGALVEAGATVLDTRQPSAYDAAHVRSALNLPFSRTGVGTRAGWVLAGEEPTVLIGDDLATVTRVAAAMHAVGLWNIEGYAVANVDAWEHAGLAVERAGAWDVPTLAAHLRSDDVDLVDVRDAREWAAGHVAGSRHLPLNQLGTTGSLKASSSRSTIAVVCASGARAALSASVLRRAGSSPVVRVFGGGVPDLARLGISLSNGAT